MIHTDTQPINGKLPFICHLINYVNANVYVSNVDDETDIDNANMHICYLF